MAGEEVLEEKQKQFYRDQLRSARAAALADAEGFLAVIHTLELMGQQMKGKVLNLGRYKNKLTCVADDSPLCDEVASKCPAYHTTFSTLYDELRRARNDAVHQGAYARILTDHAVDLAIILEDALMPNSECSRVSQFMVRDVVKAESWHPVSYARQQMLKHGFSYIPVRFENDQWRMLSEYSVAEYLRAYPDKRSDRLVKTIEKAKKDGLKLPLVDEEHHIVGPEKLVSSILGCIGASPILVVASKRGNEPERKDELVGILTAADLL